MSRKARKKSATDIYHVMVRGLNKMPVFKETREKTRIINLIRENLSKYEVHIYAYCIMSNHFHLLIKADLKELASFMAKVLAAFAKYYNYKHNRVGYVFQDRFKSQCVENESYFWNCMRYIHCNPVRDGNVKELLKCRYSSMKEYYKEENDLISNDALGLLQNRFCNKQEFLEFHQNGSWEIFDDIYEDTLNNNLRIAKELMNNYAWKYNLSKLEILQYVKTRKEYEEELSGILKCSKKYIGMIYDILMDDLRRDRD